MLPLSFLVLTLGLVKKCSLIIALRLLSNREVKVSGKGIDTYQHISHLRSGSSSPATDPTHGTAEDLQNTL